MDNQENNAAEGKDNIGIKVVLTEPSNQKITFPQNNGMVVLGDGVMPENKEHENVVPSISPSGVTVNDNGEYSYNPNQNLNLIDFPETEGIKKIMVSKGSKVTFHAGVKANAVLVQENAFLEMTNPVDEDGNSNNSIAHLFLEAGATFKVGNTFIHGVNSQFYNEYDNLHLEVVLGDNQLSEEAGAVPVEAAGVVPVDIPA